MVEHADVGADRGGDAERLNRVFGALADPTRRDLVARLASVDDASVSELAAPYDVSLQAISKHLKVLEDAGLVRRSRDAQRRPVQLDAEVFDLMTKWIERYRAEAEARFRRLDALLARIDDDGTLRPAPRSPDPAPNPPTPDPGAEERAS